MAEIGSQQIGPYTIIRLLGEGASARTYLGKHQARSKNYIIVKVFHTPLTTDEARQTYLARAKLLKKLKHRTIAEILDFGLIPEQKTQQDLGYLVLQYVQGSPITQHFSPGSCNNPTEVKRVLTPIADALQYAHAMHIQHGNLHPGNLLLAERNTLMLTDFSLLPSEVLQAANNSSAALPYQAPEQLRGNLLPASDQYALAVMTYEWLCGRRPYTATGREALLRQQEQEPVPAPRSLNSDISPMVEQVLLKALSPNPGDRFPHIQTFADAYLRALMGFPLPAGLSTPSIANSTHAVETQFTAPASSTPEVGAQFIAPEGTTDDIPAPDLAENEAAGTHEDSKQHKKRSSRKDIYDLQQTVTADLSHGGILSKRLEGYEERPAQIEMTQLVAQALVNERPAIIEAATGTGKSLAYLLPIVRSGRGAIISTANKALQEQLFYKDIPFVKKHVQDFEAALVKGVGNYVCLDRLDDERKSGQAEKYPEFTRLLSIVKEFELTISGDFETLGFLLPADLRSRVNADTDQCAWYECNFFPKCYVRQMKEMAEQAQVIVVNHTLLLLDAATNGHVLPQREVIVVDEAHHLEEEATRAFTTTISQSQILALLALRRLREYSSASLQEEAKQTMALTWDYLAEVADPGSKGRSNLRQPVEQGLRLATVIDELAASLEKNRPLYMPDKETILYDKLITRTTNLAGAIRQVFSVNQTDRFVYYVERIYTPARRTSHLEISAAPLDVTTWLKEKVFSKSTVICTSATLATVGQHPAHQGDREPNFVYYRKRVGLDYREYPHILERILPLTFDYKKNALLYVPRHLPPPVFGEGSTPYMKAIADEMMRLVEASRGRAFLLFSSKRMLDDVFNEFYIRLPNHLKFRLLRQGDSTRIDLVRTFRQEEGCVLFGLKSFWEGVDITGEALSLVVIDKLPFDPPDDPVHEARVAQMKAAGEDWFGTYVLPQAVLRLKQGLGRLLRTREDRGVMAILDTRLHTKGYGKLVLNALPPARRTHDLKDVERFFAEEDAPF